MAPALLAEAILRPSGAPRWGPDRCAASHALEMLYPDLEDSPEAREGSAAHHYVSEALSFRPVAVGDLAPNGHPIDAEMIEHGAVYVKDVQMARSVCRHETSSFRVEQFLKAHTWVHPKCEGTPDAYLINTREGWLYIWDYKYGHGYVEVYQHWQLVAYFAAICESYGLTREDAAKLTVVFRVIQPRNYKAGGPIREWVATGAEVLALVDRLRDAAHRAKQPDAPAQTGEHCRDCNGRHACSLFAQVTGVAMDIAGETVPDNLPADALGRELKRIVIAERRLAARKTGLEEEAMARIRRGEAVSYWRIGNADTKERWNVPVGEVFALGDLMGANLRKAPEPVTPNEARKRMKVDATVTAGYTIKPTGAQKLVPIEDTAAAQAFGSPKGND